MSSNRLKDAFERIKSELYTLQEQNQYLYRYIYEQQYVLETMQKEHYNSIIMLKQQIKEVLESNRILTQHLQTISEMHNQEVELFKQEIEELKTEIETQKVEILEQKEQKSDDFDPKSEDSQFPPEMRPFFGFPSPASLLTNPEQKLINVLLELQDPQSYDNLVKHTAQSINTMRVHMNSLKKKGFVEEFTLPTGIKLFSVSNKEKVRKLYNVNL